MKPVARCIFKVVFPLSLLTAALATVLFGSYALSFSSPEWSQFLAREIQAACRDTGTQWMVVTCLLSYFIVFVVLEAKSKAQSLKSKIDNQSEVSGLKSEVESRHPSLVTCHLFRDLDFWLVAFVVLVLLRYTFDYANAAKSLQVVVLLTGIVIGKGIALWTKWLPSPKSKVQSPKSGEVSEPSSIFHLLSSSRQSAVLGILVLLLAVAALWQPERGMNYFYRGQQRWTGPWDNPNLFGLLMGVGLTLALGLFVQRLMSRGQGRESKVESREAKERHLTPTLSPDEAEREGERPTCNFQLSTCNVTHWLCLTLYFCAAVLCGIGLAKSYSRGAWLGTGLGLGFLVWKWINQTHLTPARSREETERPTPNAQHPTSNAEEVNGLSATPSTLNSQLSTKQALLSCSSCVSWLRKNWFPSSILFISIFVICFWQFRHTEAPLARRVFSAGNVNDFSWRNRVAAWEGAGRMMLAKPLAGFGWNKAEEVYSKQYRAARLEESAAIQMNDYLMIGISAGVPALVCLLVYLCLVVGRGVGKLSTFNFQLSTAAKAGAVVLLIGFWFDGGLFKLPTAVVFWVLIELARRADISVCQFGRLSSRQVREHLAGKHGTGMSREPAGWKTCPTIILRWLAGLAAILALGLTALHLITPQLAVSERTLALARKFIVPIKEQADFEFLAAKPIWSGQPLKNLLQHAHLANYNRALVNWKLDDQLYREFVLSPEINPSPGLAATLSPSDGERDGVRGGEPGSLQPSTLNSEPSTDLGWRRPLWEFFYPRIRKESNSETAAEIVIRQLREQVKATNDANVSTTILESWRRGAAGEANFQILAVATLRSVGIPARLSASGVAEFWNSAEWKPALAATK